MTHQKAALLPFSKMAPYFNYIISMDTKGPINPASEGHHYIYVIVDHFSNYIATVPAQKIMLTVLFMLYCITGFQNSDLLSILLLIEDLNILILK